MVRGAWKQYCHWQVDECLRSAILHEARHFFSLPQARTGAPSVPVGARLQAVAGAVWVVHHSDHQGVDIYSQLGLISWLPAHRREHHEGPDENGCDPRACLFHPICLRGTRMRMRPSTCSPSQREHAGTGVARRISAATNGSTQGIVEPSRSAVGIRLATPFAINFLWFCL